MGYILSSRADSATQQDNLWASDMAHQVKVLSGQPGYLNSIPKNFIVEGKNLFSCPLPIIFTSDICKHVNANSKFKKNVLRVISSILSTLLFPLYLLPSPYEWGI